MAGTTSEAIANTKLLLGFVKTSLDELLQNSKEHKIRQKAYANIMAYGRSVTIGLQNLKTSVGQEGFNRWYLPIQTEMKGDELLKEFVEARNRLLKQGSLNQTLNGYIHSLDMNKVRDLQKNAPPNTYRTFVGDEWGGSGWEVEMPDGTTEKIYADFDLGEKSFIDTLFVPVQIKHKGEFIENPTIEKCCTLYYEYLKGVVESAISEFIKKTGGTHPV